LDAEPVDYCREIEAYLCRKNDGHLIRVVGPAFEIVSRWAADGVPLRVAFKGIDRYFERYYAKGPRRRPVRVEFCDADVRDVFDEWRRAVGIRDASAEPPAGGDGAERRGPSLPAHLERVVVRLTAARAAGTLGDEADPVIDRISAELDAARASARGVRGDARGQLIARLAQLDRELLDLARRTLTMEQQQRFAADADAELGAFRSTMSADAYARAHDAAVDRLVREHAGLPVVTFG
jgi:hypothetical protein